MTVRRATTVGPRDFDMLDLGNIAAMFQRICSWLGTEFVPKSDSQVKRLLATREDIFPAHTGQDFEAVFAESFELCGSRKVDESERAIYTMKAI